MPSIAVTPEPPKPPEPVDDGIPKDWKQGRATRAEEWFASQRDSCATSFSDAAQAVIDQDVAQKEAAAAGLAKRMRCGAHTAAQEAQRQQIKQMKERQLRSLAVSTSFSQVITIPHHVSPRPVVVLNHTASSSFSERLLVRGLVSSLLANCMDQELQATQGGSTGGTFLDVVWWDALQGELAAPHKGLARLEALELCRCAIMVLSPGYSDAPEHDAERAVYLNRLLHPRAYRAGQMQPIIVRLLDPAEFAAGRRLDLHVPPAPQGSPQPPQVQMVDVNARLGPREQLAQVMERLREPLLECGVEMLPEVQVFWHPTQSASAALLPGASASLSSTASLATSLYPATLSAGPGAAWAASHQVPPPHQVKPLDDWSTADVQVWIQTLGASTAAHAPALLRLHVDGWLLGCATAADLQRMCGPGSAGAVTHIMQHLAPIPRAPPGASGGAGASGRPANSEAASTPAPLAELLALGDHGQAQVFNDVLMCYDLDGTNDLDATETAALLAAMGLVLSPGESRDVLNEYDVDGDGALNGGELHGLMSDFVCLLLARSDAAAWQPLARATSASYRGSEDGSMNGSEAGRPSGPSPWNGAMSMARPAAKSPGLEVLNFGGGGATSTSASFSNTAKRSVPPTAASLAAATVASLRLTQGSRLADHELRPELSHILGGTDLNHRGLLDAGALREALGHGALGHVLSPLQIRLLVRLDKSRATPTKQLQHTIGGSWVVKRQYVTEAAATVLASRHELQQAVYDPDQGTTGLLAALYRQAAARVVAQGDSNVPDGEVDETVALEVLIAYLNTLGGQPSSLIRHALAQEAAATAAAVAHGDDAVLAWARVVAHMMYVLQRL